jgi:hypothetical protein
VFIAVVVWAPHGLVKLQLSGLRRAKR